MNKRNIVGAIGLVVALAVFIWVAVYLIDPPDRLNPNQKILEDLQEEQRRRGIE